MPDADLVELWRRVNAIPHMAPTFLSGGHHSDSVPTDYLLDYVRQDAVQHRRIRGGPYRVLDVGSGRDAPLAHALTDAHATRPEDALSPFEVHAVDLFPPFNIESNVRYHPGSAQRLPLEDGSIHSAIFSNVLEYFEDKPAALREVRRVLAKEGLLLLFLHASDINSVGLQRHGHAVRTVYPQIAACLKGRASRADTLRSIETSGLHDSMGYGSPKELLDHFEADPNLSAWLRAQSRAHSGEALEELGRRLERNRFKSPQEALRVLIENGFYPDPQVAELGKRKFGKPAYWVIAARKMPHAVCRQLLPRLRG